MVLSETWFMEGYVDFELQKYRLLAYLQEVKKSFSETRLYPQLADLVYHYNNLIAFRNNKQHLKNQFPQRLQGVNLQKMEAVYERMLNDSAMMEELQSIADYATAQLNEIIREGAEIYEDIENKLSVEAIGILPLYKKEGYVFFDADALNEIRIYSYSITLFESSELKYKGIRMEYLESEPKSLASTLEQIKVNMVRRYRALPNPAVYRVGHPASVPLDETVLPIAKRTLVKLIEQQSA